MGQRLLLAALLVTTCLAQYSLNYKEGTLVYKFPEPVNWGNFTITFTIKPQFSDDTAMDQNLIYIESAVDKDQYDFITVNVIYGNVMVTFSTPKSTGITSGANINKVTMYCLNSLGWDMFEAPTAVTIKKRGRSFTLAMEGLTHFYCNTDMAPFIGAADEDGTIKNVNLIKVGQNVGDGEPYIGCISQLTIAGMDFLPADDCGYPLQYLTGDVVYSAGDCTANSSIPAVCPTPPAPKEPTEPKKETTEPKKETEPKETTPEPETLPKPDPTPATETKPPHNIPATEPSSNIRDPEKEKENKVEYIVEEEEDPEENSEIEATTGGEKTKDNKALIVIICVVCAGVILVVVLLYVGYKFHFRDKGSYKLDDGKNEPNNDEFGNEYAELNPTTKDQEWYL